MYIFNPIETNEREHLILSPDLESHTSFEDENFNIFFRNIELSKNVQKIVSIYMEYEIAPLVYEKYPQIYKKQAAKIQKMICQHLQFDYLNLFYNNKNYFYIVTCDITEDQLLENYMKLHQVLTKKTIIHNQKEFKFKLACGVYYSRNLKISPVDFYNNARRQFFNTQLHDQSLISVLNFPID